jgi:putative copper export protein
MDVAIRSLHLIGAAVWAGGLVFLGVAAGVARATVPERERIAFFRDLGRRFLAVAALAALLLAATGIEMAADELDGWGELTGTGEGRILLAKTALFGAALALAAVHSFALGPRIRRAREALLERPEDPGLKAGLRRASALSGAVSGLILAFTAAILVLAADLEA